MECKELWAQAVFNPHYHNSVIHITILKPKNTNKFVMELANTSNPNKKHIDMVVCNNIGEYLMSSSHFMPSLEMFANSLLNSSTVDHSL